MQGSRKRCKLIWCAGTDKGQLPVSDSRLVLQILSHIYEAQWFSAVTIRLCAEQTGWTIASISRTVANQIESIPMRSRSYCYKIHGTVVIAEKSSSSPLLSWTTASTMLTVKQLFLLISSFVSTFIDFVNNNWTYVTFAWLSSRLRIPHFIHNLFSAEIHPHLT